MANPTVFDVDVYIEARHNRLQCLRDGLGARAFDRMKILEVGCGLGDIGEAFAIRGSKVVSIDARPEFIEALRGKYPNREAYVVDLEDWQPTQFGHFDAILCFGLLYHLSRPTDFLRTCPEISGELWLETTVCDSTEANYPIVPEAGDDQAHSGMGCRPSPSWISIALGHFGYAVRDISSATANWGGTAPSIFDWEPQDDGAWQRDGSFLRKCSCASAFGLDKGM